MYGSQWPWIELYRAILEHGGDNAFDDVLAPWLEKHADERHWLSDFSQRTETDWSAATHEDLCRLYAAFRVTSTLLLRFQHGRADGTDYPGPAISVEGYQLFHEALGFSVPSVSAFHPFYHEIISVTQAASSATPIELVEQRWPAFMLGNLMFCRAGCVVEGGSDHVLKGIAEASKLYWTFRRKDRPCDDLSHGWGSNSQWRTRLRRDYQTSSGFHYNVDARKRLESTSEIVDGLSFAAMRELIRNRCMIRTAVDDSDLCPYSYSDTEVE